MSAVFGKKTILGTPGPQKGLHFGAFWGAEVATILSKGRPGVQKAGFEKRSKFWSVKSAKWGSKLSEKRSVRERRGIRGGRDCMRLSLVSSTPSVLRLGLQLRYHCRLVLVMEILCHPVCFDVFCFVTCR